MNAICFLFEVLRRAPSRLKTPCKYITQKKSRAGKRGFLSYKRNLFFPGARL
jgi:hypothetical protein